MRLPKSYRFGQNRPYNILHNDEHAAAYSQTLDLMKMKKLDPSSLDFERCEDEQIHTPESIQGYGYLIAFNKETFEVSVISQNVEKLLNLDSVIGTNFSICWSKTVMDESFC